MPQWVKLKTINNSYDPHYILVTASLYQTTYVSSMTPLFSITKVSINQSLAIIWSTINWEIMANYYLTHKWNAHKKWNNARLILQTSDTTWGQRELDLPFINSNIHKEKNVGIFFIVSQHSDGADGRHGRQESLKPISPLDKMAAILADDNFKCIFLNENDRILIPISLKFVPRCPIDNKPALIQVMAWRRTGDKPLPELMLTQCTKAYMGH